MNRNVFGFFKPSACVKSFLVFGAALFATLSISCKQLASFDPVVDGGQTVVGSGGDTSSLETTEFSFNLKATHGLLRKISLEWTAFSGAKYYEIYFAESSVSEFVKIGETQQPFFDDPVGAGRTGYFKVCAIKANGSSSPFSSTVVGTSLAVPIIGDGEVGDSAATITWFMENARGIDGTDYYEKSLKFEVVCQPKGGSDGESKVLSASSLGSSYSCTFEELSSSQDYEFYVEAYLDGDTQSREKSPVVDKTTLTTYMPLAPKFSVSEGESAKGISLLITLPEMVTVNTFVKNSENPNVKQDISFPLCFEIYRKHEKAETYPEDPVGGIVNGVKCKLYYNGTTELTKSPVEYQEGGAPYEAGKQVVWFDDDASLIGGEKYDYMIRSVPDINYSKVVCPDDKQYSNDDGKITPTQNATTAQGWKSASPSFNVKVGDDGGRKLSANKDKVVSISFGFSAEWKDLGKAGDYKFAINRSLTPWNSNSSTSEWLKNGETVFFETLDGINSRVETFGSESGGLSKSEQGSYSYTLYIVSKNDNGTEKIESDYNILDRITARDRIVVTEDVDLPKAELKAEGGHKDKVVLEIPTYEPNVTYELERAELVGNNPTNEKTIGLSAPTSGTFKYEDTVEGNRKYSYVLKAIAKSGVFTLSKSQIAETLGTPSVSFKKEEKYFGYDSVTISFDGVLAAEKYIVTLGTNGGFGGGKNFQFASGYSGSTGNAEISLEGNTYTVTIKGPEGYDNARLAGTKANVIVTAYSGVGNAPSAPVPVNVLGPAPLIAKVNTFDTAAEGSISVSWNKVDDAKGYLIKRVMYSDIEMKNVAKGSDVAYYYEVSSGNITANGDDPEGRVTVDPSDSGFKLTDTYMEITTNDDTLKEYQEKQSKIAWGLPFKYVVLPVLKKDDFYFKDDDLSLESGKVTYANLAEKQTDGTATFGYGLNVRATKSESVTMQNVTWEKPFYGEKLTPKVYRRIFTPRDGVDAGWNEVSASVKNDAINYSPSGMDRYCAWEYVVKYVSNANANTIAPSYLDWLKDNDHDETAYDYGNKPKEKLNKGYLLAMNYSANYGGEGTSKDDADYYSEDVKITPWDYADRVLAPDKVELKVLSLDLSSGWQLVGALDPEIESFIKEETLDDTTVEYTKTNKLVKLKPTTISNNKNGTGTTKGPLKILRSAKHYYGLNLSRGGNEEFDCKNYEEYAYRQITDEEIVKSTMLILAKILYTSKMEEKTTGTVGNNDNTVSGITGGFSWGQGWSSDLKWSLTNFTETWEKLPFNEYIEEKSLPYIPSFISINDTASSEVRGRKYGKNIRYLEKDNYSTSYKKNMINLSVFPYDSEVSLKSYSCTVSFTASGSEYSKNFDVKVTRGNVTEFEKSVTGTDEVRKWCPISFDQAGWKYEDSAYGWWNN